MACDVNTCPRPVQARGLCFPHYKRWRRYGDPTAGHRRAPDHATIEERLRYVGWTETVRLPDLGPCWDWNGLTDDDGYGRVWDGTRVAAAHRLAHATWVGPIPDGHLVRHRCDVPSCIAPTHLLTGTDADNALDRGDRDRWRGKRTTRLSPDDVAQIRAAYTGARGEQAALARQHDVAPSYISAILSGGRG